MMAFLVLAFAPDAPNTSGLNWYKDDDVAEKILARVKELFGGLEMTIVSSVEVDYDDLQVAALVRVRTVVPASKRLTDDALQAGVQEVMPAGTIVEVVVDEMETDPHARPSRSYLPHNLLE